MNYVKEGFYAISVVFKRCVSEFHFGSMCSRLVNFKPFASPKYMLISCEFKSSGLRISARANKSKARSRNCLLIKLSDLTLGS